MLSFYKISIEFLMISKPNLQPLIMGNLLLPFYYIRHGETDWNLENRCMGQQDIPLNGRGIRQAEKARSLLNNRGIQTICHSPLSRAKTTAEILNETLQYPMVEIDSLKECCWGILEGQLKNNGTIFSQWDKGATPEGAESYVDFFNRIVIGLKQALSYPNPLIVSHGGVFWMILKEFFSYDLSHPGMSNCTPVYLELSNQRDVSVIKVLNEEEDAEFYEY